MLTRANCRALLVFSGTTPRSDLVCFVDERMKPFGLFHMLAESGAETPTPADFPSSRRLAPFPTDDSARRAASALRHDVSSSLRGRRLNRQSRPAARR